MTPILWVVLDVTIFLGGICVGVLIEIRAAQKDLNKIQQTTNNMIKAVDILQAKLYNQLADLTFVLAEIVSKTKNQETVKSKDILDIINKGLKNVEDKT